MKNSSYNEENQKLKSKYEDKKGIVLGTFEEIPKAFQPDEYIRNGYRLNCNSFSSSFKSLFILHNETINIWSHLLGTLASIGFFFYSVIFITNYRTQIVTFAKYLADMEYQFNILPNDINDRQYIFLMEHFFKFKYDFIYHATDPNELYEQTFMEFNDSYTKVMARLDNITDEVEVFDPFIKKYKEFYQNFIELRVQEKMAYGIKTILYTLNPLKNLETWPLIAYVLSCTLYLFISTIYHLMGNMSPSHKSALNKLKNGCISLLLTTSCYPPYYYFFYCQNNYKLFFLIIITLFGVILFFFCLTEEFNSADKRNLRGMAFLIFGLCSELPVFILTFILNDIRGHNNDASFLFLYLGMLSYLLGGILYLKRVPEKYFPGIFDYFGNSHQLFHILILPAIFLNYFAFLDIYRSRFDCLC